MKKGGFESKHFQRREPKTFYPFPSIASSLISSKDYWEVNLGLLLDKYIPWKEKWEFEERDKSQFFAQIIKSLRNPQNTNVTKRAFENFLKRWNEMLESLRNKSRLHVQEFKMRTSWRLIVNLGATSILETYIGLHRIYGFPFIPGSALKGLANWYAKEFKNVSNLELSDDEISEIFGTQDKAGKVTFLDALPSIFPEVEADVMSVHYKRYYEGSEPPADYLSPQPVYFLTVGMDNEFCFFIVSEDENLAEKAEGILKKALTEFGVGAKTGAGYGYFE